MTEQTRWTKQPGGDGADPRQTDADHYDPEQAAHRAANRAVVNDQPAEGERGISSDRPGVDGGGYPEEPPTSEPPDEPAVSPEPAPQEPPD